MRRIKSNCDYVFRVSLRPDDGNLVFRDEDHGEVRESGVTIA